MSSHRLPLHTIGLVLVTIAVYWLLPKQAPLYFGAVEIASGEAWRLVSGHFVHADLDHLFWNCLGLVVLGAVIEYRSRTWLWAALAAGIVSVDLLLLSPFPRLDYYCGLSGVLNTLLIVALWLEWRATRSWLIVVFACGSVAKAVVEATLGDSLVTHISWPPYAWSHVAGLAAGVLLVWASGCHSTRLIPWPSV